MVRIHEYGSISERRTIINCGRRITTILGENPGINSGLMIAQYTAASMVSQNKQLCTPASADSIESSNGQEDHVSMGANAATKLLKVVDNVYGILGVELLNAVQALWIRGEAVEGELGALFNDFLAVSPAIEEDIYLHERMELAKNFLKTRMLEERTIFVGQFKRMSQILAPSRKLRNANGRVHVSLLSIDVKSCQTETFDAETAQIELQSKTGKFVSVSAKEMMMDVDLSLHATKRL